MTITSSHHFVAATLIALALTSPVTLHALDCAKFENYPGLEPEGYAKVCTENDDSGALSTSQGGMSLDTAFAHELRNTRNTVIHSHDDLSDSSLIGLSTSIVFGYDYSPDLSTLYGINWGTGQLGTSDGIIFTPIGTPTRPEGHTWSGLAIDPISGEAFLSSTDSVVSTLQSVNLVTGASTLISNIGNLELVIEIAINCEGVMYAHDIGTDAIYRVDRNDGTPTLVGPHGLKTNFAQGMDFNNQSGDLYIYAYTGGGSITYGIVSLVDGSITPLNINDPMGEWEGASQTTCPGEGPARFLVEKDFDDDNPTEVGVVIECNTGLPLSQHTTISEGESVTFVVGDFNDGEMDCEITEVVPAGYSASYDDGQSTNTGNCRFEAVEAGSGQSCGIANTLDPVEVEVSKVWIDEYPQLGATNHAEAVWACTNVAFSCNEGIEDSCDSGSLAFLGNPASDGFMVFPGWNGGTRCTVEEVSVFDGNVETNDDDCATILLFPGTDGDCTIYNTRLYAGIPTSGQYGLVILALIIITAGLAAIHRTI